MDVIEVALDAERRYISTLLTIYQSESRLTDAWGLTG